MKSSNRPDVNLGHGLRDAVPFRLGIDLGVSSFGWCALECDSDDVPIGVLDGGVRVYSDGRDPKTGASLALARRDARGARRRRDRYLRRRTVLLDELIRSGLMPQEDADRKALELVDPYHIRAAALDQQVPLHFFGRALFHLNQRRGFKSNRKIDQRVDDVECGVVAKGVDNLDAAMAAARARTYGEFLAKRQALEPYQHQAEGRRARVRRDTGSGDFAFFPARRHLEEEFHALWDAQQSFYPDVLIEAARTRISRIIFFQREHKPPLVGCCAFTGEPRIAKAHPTFQRMRLFKLLNRFTVEEAGKSSRLLTKEERDRVLLAFRSPKTTKRRIAWSVVYKASQLPLQARFKGEEQERSGVTGDEVEAQMVKHYGLEWRTLPTNEQWRIIERLRNEDDETTLLSFLQNDIRLSPETATALAKVRLPSGYGRVSEKAARRILAELEADVISENEAIARCGWKNTTSYRTAGLEALPYYGEILEHLIPPGTQDPDDPPEECYGQVGNPSLHIALGQLRRVVNAIIVRHGHPREIIVQISRDLKLSETQRQEIKRIIKRSTQAAIGRGATLEQLGVANTGANRALVQIWEDLHPEPSARVCVYTGQPISVEMLFLNETAVDYILPISATLDDSNANKLVVMASAKEAKGSLTPFAAFGGTPEWNAILARTQSLPEKKRWRFAPDALDRFGSGTGLLAQHLRDPDYVARLIKTYLDALYPAQDEHHDRVRVIRGTLTEALRRCWRLNDLLPDHEYAHTSKPRARTDHRHQVINAFVVALSDDHFLTRLAAAAEASAALGNSAFSANIPTPWPFFREMLSLLVNRTVVSHRPDHGSLSRASDRAKGRDQTAGRLHNDTAYGLTGEKNDKGSDLVVRRVPLLSLDSPEKIATVRDPRLRSELAAALKGATGKQWQSELTRFAEKHEVYRDIRRVRVVEPAKTIGIQDKQGRAFKSYKGNSIHRIDIWRLPCSDWVSNWVDDDDREISGAIQMLDAHRANRERSQLRPHPAAKKVLSLQRNDLIALEHPQYGKCICRVVKLRETGQITIARHMEAGDLIKRNKCAVDPFRYYAPSASGLKKAGARQIRIDELGKVWDPGPRELPSSDREDPVGRRRQPQEVAARDARIIEPKKLIVPY